MLLINQYRLHSLWLYAQILCLCISNVYTRVYVLYVKVRISVTVDSVQVLKLTIDEYVVKLSNVTVSYSLLLMYSC